MHSTQADNELKEEHLLNFVVNSPDEDFSLDLEDNVEVTSEKLYEVLAGAVGWDINSYSISRAVAKTKIPRSQPDYKEMTSRRDSKTGRYEEFYTDEEILKLLTGTRLGTSEVADQLNCYRTTAHDKLTQLEQEGLVSSTSINTLAWELADERPSNRVR